MKGEFSGKINTKEDIEIETLKIFLKNKNFELNVELIDLIKNEPTDIRYNMVLITRSLQVITNI